MVCFKSALVASAAAGALAVPYTQPDTLDLNNTDSIKAVAGSLAHGAMSYYNGNVSSDAKMVGDLPEPYYWWQAGALWGAMLDYYHYTGDPSYNEVIAQALTAKVNTGPNFDFMPPEHASEEGNDDLGFWGFAVMAAAERNFTQPNPDAPSWLRMGINIFDSLASRWNTTHCGGGLLWQIYESNPNGLNYKNSVSNGGFFQLAARLGRATGEQKYFDWANKVWDWSEKVGFIDADLKVYDGADSRDECTKVNPLSFTYSTGIYLYGAAVMANATGQSLWHDRAVKMLDTSKHFFGPFENSTNIMYEPACETVGTCNTDMKTFKGYLSRFMYKSAQDLPELKPEVLKLMTPTTQAAANACTANDTGVVCGQKWYVGGNDQSVGLGQMMSALEALVLNDNLHASADGSLGVNGDFDVLEENITSGKLNIDTRGSQPGANGRATGNLKTTIDYEVKHQIRLKGDGSLKAGFKGQASTGEAARKQKADSGKKCNDGHRLGLGAWNVAAVVAGSQVLFWGIL
ncbi:glycosyl hydrolase family 76 [Colletotrichum gloeosporioides Cg-14]|uniref:mannan endo-1,6-alpha-mannosidase n=1 Tax=Colletotrichum gloeosporioides (strain Cg-14) TaxID=1237896 RepID=T0K3F9_COLGC|nr:glycosyl hydrolase family 76 [Colletotrichum gloeosporioides Cg-14]